MKRSTVWTVALSAAVLVGLAVALTPSVPPPAPGSDAPTGTLALEHLLRDRGIRVSEAGDPPPPPGAFVLLGDLRSDRQARPLLNWAARGGTLVVADPASVIDSVLGVAPGGRIGGILAAFRAEPGCLTPLARGVRTLVVDVADQGLATNDARALGCFQGPGGSFAVLVPRGRGRVILLGGRSPFTNAYLREGDDALFALRTLGAGGTVVFGLPVPPGTADQGSAQPRSVWSLLPARARAALVGLTVAVLAFGLVRGRRMGGPVVEEPISPIPASELVRASAALYRSAGDRAFTAGLLRERAVAGLVRRLGLPAGATPTDVAAMLRASDPGAAARAEQALLGPEPRTDEELIALGRDLDAVSAEIGR